MAENRARAALVAARCGNVSRETYSRAHQRATEWVISGTALDQSRLHGSRAGASRWNRRESSRDMLVKRQNAPPKGDRGQARRIENPVRGRPFCRALIGLVDGLGRLHIRCHRPFGLGMLAAPLAHEFVRDPLRLIAGLGLTGLYAGHFDGGLAVARHAYS